MMRNVGFYNDSELEEMATLGPNFTVHSPDSPASEDDITDRVAIDLAPLAPAGESREAYSEHKKPSLPAFQGVRILIHHWQFGLMHVVTLGVTRRLRRDFDDDDDDGGDADECDASPTVSPTDLSTIKPIQAEALTWIARFLKASAWIVGANKLR